MRGASPGNPLPINSWECMFGSVLGTATLKEGKEAIGLLHPGCRVGEVRE